MVKSLIEVKSQGTMRMRNRWTNLDCVVKKGTTRMSLNSNIIWISVSASCHLMRVKLCTLW